MRPLSDLMGTPLARDREIAGLTADSREVRRGWLFAALPGTKVDGRIFVAEAINRGAAAVLAATGTQLPDNGNDAVLVTDDNPRRRFALMAARFFDAQPATIAAVTGTNGKTSVASFARQIWGQLGHASASLGTLGVIAPGWDNTGGLTTPDPVSLHKTLADLAGLGISHAAIEASSHGLSQYRLDGVKVSAAAFTNLTRDHLDYHADMDDYAAAKLRLFSEVVSEDGAAVINADSSLAARIAEMCRERHLRVLTFGARSDAITLRSAMPQPGGQRLALTVLGQDFDVLLPLAGAFQASNALCALGLVIACGGNREAAVVALEQLEGVPGRLQRVAVTASGAPVFVDYAHTPDALGTVLAALRPHAARRLSVVFGCGGDRDPGKRPQMGKIAAEMADAVIVTDDNPRGEDAAAIRAQIMAACPGAREIASRSDAIRAAVAGLGEGDVLVVAGKGHEQGQIVKDTVLPFDDAQECAKAVAGGAP